MIANHDLIVCHELVQLASPPIHDDAIGAAQILDKGLLGGGNDLAVMPADKLTVELQFAIGAAPDGDPPGREQQALRGDAAVLHVQFCAYRFALWLRWHAHRRCRCTRRKFHPFEFMRSVANFADPHARAVVRFSQGHGGIAHLVDELRRAAGIALNFWKGVGVEQIARAAAGNVESPTHVAFRASDIQAWQVQRADRWPLSTGGSRGGVAGERGQLLGQFRRTSQNHQRRRLPGAELQQLL